MGGSGRRGLLFYPMGVPYAEKIHASVTGRIAEGVSATAIFFVTLVVVSIITVKISDVILDSKVGALDRSLGFLFGAARGLLLGVVAFQFFGWLVPEKSQPEWVRTAKTGRCWYLRRIADGTDACGHGSLYPAVEAPEG